MKLNKTLMIAALVAGTVFAADVAVYAQDATNPPPAGARPPGARGGNRMNFDSISTQLELTDDQKTKARPIFQDMMTKMADLRKDTTMDQTDRRAKIKEIRDATTAQFKDIFTADQMDKWQKMQTGNRRPPGGAGAPPPGGATPPPPPAPPAGQQ